MTEKKSKNSKEVLLPREGESAAIAGKVKTAALCYDRIWCPPQNVFQWTEEFPHNVRFFGGTDVEETITFDISDKSIKTFPSLKKLFESSEGMDLIRNSTLDIMADIIRFKNSEEKTVETLERDKKIPVSEREEFFDNTNIIMDLIYRDVAKAVSKKFQIPVVTVCESRKNQRVIYSGGNKEAVISCLQNLRIVNEKKLSWEQVLDFRADVDSRRKYKRFLHWLDKEMIGKSREFIEDDIAIKLEDYESALKKHGIMTVIGTVDEALDGKYLAGVLGVTAPLILTGHPTLGILAGAGLVVGKIGIKLSQVLLDYDDVERGTNSEISWVYEVKQLGK